MARKETVLDVLVSSPSDVVPERNAVREVITEWNATWARERGLRLNLLTWETDTFPGVGDDAQDVINKQIGDDYDIFIGILWGRFGTPTKKASSGTSEEFERAYRRYQKGHEGIAIMFYFKDEPIRPSEIDPKQLVKVEEFKKSLSSMGALYHQFQSTDEFERLLRIHLGKQSQVFSVQDTSVLLNSHIAENVTRREVPHEEGHEDGEGFLDLIDEGVLHFQKATGVTKTISDAVDAYARQVTEQTQGLAQADDLLTKKKILKTSAGSMITMATVIEKALPEFRDAYTIAFDSYGKAASIILDFETTNAEDVQEALESVQGLRQSIEKSRGQMIGFRGTVENLPRLTTQLNKAKARVRKVLTDLDNEMGAAINLAGEVEDLMEGVVREILESQRQEIETDSEGHEDPNDPSD